MSRHGKIARMPVHLRRAVNERLEQGTAGRRIVGWLNRQPEARAVLAEWFDGRPVTPQNLSEWRKGGFRDWQRQEQAGGLALRVFGKAGAPDGAAGTGGFPDKDRLATVLLAELVALFQTWQDDTTDLKERWRRLKDVIGTLTRMRLADVRSGRLTLDRIKQHVIGDGQEEEMSLMKRMMEEGLGRWLTDDSGDPPGAGEIGRILDRSFCPGTVGPAKAAPAARSPRGPGRRQAKDRRRGAQRKDGTDAYKSVKNEPPPIQVNPSQSKCGSSGGGESGGSDAGSPGLDDPGSTRVHPGPSGPDPVKPMDAG